MKINALARSMTAVLVVSGFLIVTGCSGSQEDEEKMEATPEEEPKEEAAEPVAEEPAEEAAVTEEAAPVAEVPSTPSMNSAVDKSRVVRYVSKDQATVHGQPDEKAETVGKLMKGDMILVVETNGWGKISDTMYIRLNSLSKKAVPRTRNPAVWGKPAH
jgi:hypothetical protein